MIRPHLVFPLALLIASACAAPATTVLSLSGASCAGCGMGAVTTLEKLDGVDAVSFDKDSAEVSVVHDPETVAVGQLVDALKDGDYTVKVGPGQGGYAAAPTFAEGLDVAWINEAGSDVDFETKLVAGKVTVVDFFAEWCGPCKRVAPQFAELATKHQRVARFAKVDVDAAPDLAQNAGVRAMPTFHIYKAGERVFELKGADIGKLEAAVLQWSTDVGAALEAAEAPPLPQVALLHFDEGRLEKILPRLLKCDHELRQTSDDDVRAEPTRENHGPLHTV